MEDLSETGATGDPSKFDPELGIAILDELADAFSDFLGDLWSDN